MVAKITFPKRLLDVLNYNEKKVQKGAAQCIGAGGYLRTPEEMNFYQKLEGLQRRNELNDRAATKTLHVSLNFDPSENLSNETLLRIAEEYMERIGFGAQPYLVYRHQDAGHPHLHIVSTTIQPDGSRINTHNLGRKQSEKARKELEVTFGLVRAQKKSLDTILKPARPVPVQYGRSETKRSIAGVVTTVFNTYAFTSLPEYNAALRQFGVLADRGKEEGRIYRQGGLVYRILDEKGEKVGVPIKASSLAGKPTLEALQARFALNEERRGIHKASLAKKVDACLITAPSSVQELIEALDKKGVFTLPRKNADGRLYGITFVDHQTRCVFNGSDLGRGFSAAAIQARLAITAPVIKAAFADKQEGNQTGVSKDQQKTVTIKAVQKPQPKESWGDLLLATRSSFDHVPSELLKKKKRKKNRSHGM